MGERNAITLIKSANLSIVLIALEDSVFLLTIATTAVADEPSVRPPLT